MSNDPFVTKKNQISYWIFFNRLRNEFRKELFKQFHGHFHWLKLFEEFLLKNLTNYYDLNLLRPEKTPPYSPPRANSDCSHRYMHLQALITQRTWVQCERNEYLACSREQLGPLWWVFYKNPAASLFTHLRMTLFPGICEYGTDPHFSANRRSFISTLLINTT